MDKTCLKQMYITSKRHYQRKTDWIGVFIGSLYEIEFELRPKNQVLCLGPPIKTPPILDCLKTFEKYSQHDVSE